MQLNVLVHTHFNINENDLRTEQQYIYIFIILSFSSNIPKNRKYKNIYTKNGFKRFVHYFM